MSTRRLPWARVALAAVIAAGALLCSAREASAAGTAAGVTISNTSSASYQDANSVSYGANSNTVSVVVQNAPSVLVTAGSTKVIAPGQTVTDAMTIQNTGNASGDVQITAGGVTGGTDSASASGTVAYLYNSTSYSSLALLNGALASVPVAVSGTITVSVVYTLASTAASPGDVQTNLTATMTYAAVGTAPAATSTGVPSASPETDTVTLDALLDVALSAVTTSSLITYTLTAVDRTTVWGAKDLAAVKQLLSSANPGVFISAKIPQYPAGTPLTISGTPAVTTSTTYGYPTLGSPSAVIYSTASTSGPGSGWAPGVIANATYIGVLISGGSCTINGSTMTGIEICPIAASGSSAGNVPNPAITLTFAVLPSTASGSANANSTQTIGNSLIGSNAATEQVIAPGITAYSLADGTGVTSAITAAGAGINNTTSVNTPSGASALNQTATVSAYALANGPFGSAATAAATGSYDSSPNDNNHDFTAVSFVSTNPNYTTTNTTGTYTPTTTSTTAAAVTINVENTLANTGNSNDTYTILATAPSGWTVYLEIATPGSPDTPGGSLGLASAGATSNATNVPVASGATLNYFAVYTAPAATPYLSHGVGTINATSVGNSALSNLTANLIYAGFVAVTTTATTTPNCPAGTSPAAGTVCPGGTIVYVIDYRNVVNNVDVSSVPTVSFARVMTKAGTFAITADGTNVTVATNNWATTTNGPTAAPVDTTSNTTYTYWTGATGTAGGGAIWVAATTKFIATVGGGAFVLAPALSTLGTSQGTITFSVIVK